MVPQQAHRTRGKECLILVKTKMIRIPKRGGGTRLQKVRVLASGKYRFMKNPTTSKRTRKTSKPKRRRSVRRTARKKRRRRKRGMTIPLAPVAGLAYGIAGGPYPPLESLLRGDIQATLLRFAERYTGINKFGQFEPAKLSMGVLPLIAGVLVHKFVGGSPLNLNRTLAAAGVPFLRL